MKYILSLMVVVIISVNGIAQNKNAKHVFKVNGICEMCKERIEEACLKTKGVKYADWNIETKQLKVFINEKKTNIKTVKENIAKVGHDTDTVKATQEDYNNIHGCCKYREDETH